MKYDYTIPIDVKTMIERMFSNPTDMILGITPESKIISLALAKAPHLLLAGETGSGKSVNIQQMLITMMVHHTPEYSRIGIIDPKEVDFQFY
ncbi:FtsK/SpoIIIE domain-containing protein [Staphylococcus pseudintermedius]